MKFNKLPLRSYVISISAVKRHRENAVGVENQFVQPMHTREIVLALIQTLKVLRLNMNILIVLLVNQRLNVV